MTQAIVSNLTKQEIGSVIANSASHELDNQKFDRMLDNNMNKFMTSTISSIKNKSFGSEISRKMFEFSEFLSKTTNEVNVENSLNLTLSQDAGKVIDQVRKIFKADENEDSSQNFDNESFSTVVHGSEPTIESETSENDENSDAILLAQAVMIVDQKVNNQIKAETENALSCEDLNDLLTSGEVGTQIAGEEAPLTEELTELSENLMSESAEDLHSESVRTNTENELELDMLEELEVEVLEAEEGTFSEGDSLMNRQSPEEQGLKAMLNHESVRVNTASEQFVMKDVSAPQMDSGVTNRLVEQISKQIENLQNGSKLNLNLNSETIGKVNVQLINTKEGLSAQFTVASQDAKEIIMKGLDGLKESLLYHGVNIDNISVKLNESQKSEYKQDWTEQDGSRGGNKEERQQRREEKDTPVFEDLIAQDLNENNV